MCPMHMPSPQTPPSSSFLPFLGSTAGIQTDTGTPQGCLMEGDLKPLNDVYDFLFRVSLASEDPR